MLGIMNSEPLNLRKPEPPEPEREATPRLETKQGAAPEKSSPERDSEEKSEGGSGDFEVVLGKGQIAVWLFVMLAAVALCSSGAYLAGQVAAAKRKALASAPQRAEQRSQPAQSPVTSSVTPSSAAPVAKAAAPLFGEPKNGKVYIQIAAVERGMAAVLAEGLRTHGLEAFVGPGPNEKLFRVLIGPLPDPATFLQTQAVVDSLDLATYARRYQSQAEAKRPVENPAAGIPLATRPVSSATPAPAAAAPSTAALTSRPIAAPSAPGASSTPAPAPGSASAH
jgi:hypothetical protein